MCKACTWDEDIGLGIEETGGTSNWSDETDGKRSNNIRNLHFKVLLFSVNDN